MEVVWSSKRLKMYSESEVSESSVCSKVASSTGCSKEKEKEKEVNPVLLLCPNFIKTCLWPVKKVVVAESPPKLAEDAYNAFSHRLPEYDDDIITNNKIEISSPIDVISLLAGGGGGNAALYRNDGWHQLVNVDEGTFGDKYILVCCFHIPIFLGGADNLFLQSLATTCLELYSTRNDLEIVLVAKMDKSLNYELLFTHFLRGFPSPCFVVPFEDSKRRDYICYRLHLRDRLRMQCLLLDNKGKEERNILFSGYPDFAEDYGADAFPYTDEKLEELNAQDFPKWKTASTSRLEGLLGCTPSDVLRNITPASGPRGEITISELKEHVVGLYLCFRGNLMTTLQHLCQQCRTKELSFEVVLVYIPFADCRDPEDFMSNIDIMLKQHNLSCWRLPFKNSVSRRLNRLMDFPYQDKVIIVGPHDAFVEPYGAKGFCNLGVDAYPFFREEFVQRQLDKVKEHTLGSSLVHGSRDYVLQGDNKIAVSELLGRHIVLYYGCLARRELFDEVFKWYYEIKANDPTFEVVFVRKNSTAVPEVDSDLLASMPWLVCPFDPVHSAFLEKEFFRDGIELRESLVEFGKNGHICSFRARNHLTCHGPFPFGDSNLHCDVIRYLRLNFNPLFG